MQLDISYLYALSLETYDNTFFYLKKRLKIHFVFPHYFFDGNITVYSY